MYGSIRDLGMKSRSWQFQSGTHIYIMEGFWWKAILDPGIGYSTSQSWRQKLRQELNSGISGLNPEKPIKPGNTINPHPLVKGSAYLGLIKTCLQAGVSVYICRSIEQNGGSHQPNCPLNVCYRWKLTLYDWCCHKFQIFYSYDTLSLLLPMTYCM